MTSTPDNFVVWTEIPVTDLQRAIKFYNQVFNTELKLDETGPNPMAIFPTANETGVAGHLYPGTPARDGTGSTIHMIVPDQLEAALERVTTAGGEVQADPIAIPPGRFAYCRDLDGNSIGLFSYTR